MSGKGMPKANLDSRIVKPIGERIMDKTETPQEFIGRVKVPGSTHRISPR